MAFRTLTPEIMGMLSTSSVQAYCRPCNGIQLFHVLDNGVETTGWCEGCHAETGFARLIMVRGGDDEKHAATPIERRLISSPLAGEAG